MYYVFILCFKSENIYLQPTPGAARSQLQQFFTWSLGVDRSCVMDPWAKIAQQSNRCIIIINQDFIIYVQDHVLFHSPLYNYKVILHSHQS